MIIPFLIATVTPQYHLLSEPTPSWHICEEMEHDIYQAVEHDIITEDQANKILMRCLINYSTGPNPHYPDEVDEKMT